MSAELYAALAAANTEITDPRKNAQANAGQYGYAYATLDEVLGHVRPVLAKNGLSIVQDCRNDDGGIYVTTTLLHASGAVLEFGPVSWPPVSKMQDFGAILSYARRYGVMAALGIAAAGDDSDAADIKADGGHAPASTTVRGGPAGRAKATSKQIGLIWRLMKAHNFTEVTLNDAIQGRYGFELPQAGLEQLTMPQASDVIEYLNSLPKDKPIVRSKPSEPDPADPWTNGQFPPDPEAGA